MNKHIENALNSYGFSFEKNSGYEMEITIVNFSEEDYLIYKTVATEI